MFGDEKCDSISKQSYYRDACIMKKQGKSFVYLKNKCEALKDKHKFKIITFHFYIY